MKVNIQGEDEATPIIDVTPIIEAIFSFSIKETDESTINDLNLEIIVWGTLKVSEKEYIIKCRHFYYIDQPCFYIGQALTGIVRKYKSDINYFFYDAIIKNFDFSMAQEKGHLVLVDGETWKKQQETYDFNVIEGGAFIACGRL